MLVAGGQEEGCLMAASGAGLRKMDRWSAADTPHWDSGWGVISCDCNCSAHVRKPHIDTVSFNVLHCFQSNFGTITTKFCYKSWLYQTSMDTGSFHGWNIAFLSFICTLQTLGLSPHNLYELVPNQEGLHLFYNPLRSHRESINLWPSLDMHYYLVIVSPARIKKIGWVVVVFIFSQCNCSPLSWDDNLILRVQGCVETAP